MDHYSEATSYLCRLASPPLLALRLRRAFLIIPSAKLALATSTDSSLMSVTETSSESYTKTWKLSWSFEADLRKEADVELESAPVLLDLSGKWCLYGKRDADSPVSVRFGIRWDGASRQAIGSTGVKIVHRLCAVDPPRSTLIQEIQEDYDEGEDEAWPFFVSGYTDRIRVDEARLEKLDVSPETQRSWRLEVQLTTHDINTVKRCTISKVAALITSLHGRPVVTQNVRLYFPKTNLELWTTPTLLSASPFFRALFESGFAEASTTRKRKRTAGAGAAASQSVVVGEDALAFEDSDDEADELYLEQEQEQPSVDASEAEFREVRISATAYSTYRALLTWLTTSHIDFAPLTSLHKPGNPGKATPGYRSGDLDDFRKAQPDLPLLVSPKAVYRLAHFLELPDLQSIALRAYKSQLDQHIVAYELVSDVSAVYDELRSAALDVAAKNFAFVRTSEAMQEVTRQMKDDEALRERFSNVIAELLAKG